MWKFDQEENVAAITTKQVLEDGLPILKIIHYSDDHSWAFLCGTTDKTEDGRVISMKEVIKIDPSIEEMHILKPGFSASRESKNQPWIVNEKMVY